MPVLLSEVVCPRMPNLLIQPDRKSSAQTVVVASFSSIASSHHVNLSVIVKRCLVLSKTGR